MKLKSIYLFIITFIVFGCAARESGSLASNSVATQRCRSTTEANKIEIIDGVTYLAHDEKLAFDSGCQSYAPRNYIASVK